MRCKANAWWSSHPGRKLNALCSVISCDLLRHHSKEQGNMKKYMFTIVATWHLLWDLVDLRVLRDEMRMVWLEFPYNLRWKCHFHRYLRIQGRVMCVFNLSRLLQWWEVLFLRETTTSFFLHNTSFFLLCSLFDPLTYYAIAYNYEIVSY